MNFRSRDKGFTSSALTKPQAGTMIRLGHRTQVPRSSATAVHGLPVPRAILSQAGCQFVSWATHSTHTGAAPLLAEGAIVYGKIAEYFRTGELP
jgi:hypothetical protein